MRKWIVEYLRQSGSRGYKITRFNPTFYLQIYQFTLYGVGVRCDGGRFSVRCPFIEKSMPRPIPSDVDLYFLYYWVICLTKCLHELHEISCQVLSVTASRSVHHKGELPSWIRGDSCGCVRVPGTVVFVVISVAELCVLVSCDLSVYLL